MPELNLLRHAPSIIILHALNLNVALADTLSFEQLSQLHSMVKAGQVSDYLQSNATIATELALNPASLPIMSELVDTYRKKSRIEWLLQSLHEHNRHLTDYPQASIKLLFVSYYDASAYDYLEFYSTQHLTSGDLSTLSQNLALLNECGGTAGQLTTVQRQYMLKKYMHNNKLIPKACYIQAVQAVTQSKPLASLLKALHKSISREIKIEAFKDILANPESYLQSLQQLKAAYWNNPGRYNRLVEYWSEFAYDRKALNTLVSQISRNPLLCLLPLYNEVDYFNILAGNGLRGLDPANMSKEKQNLLVYAAINNKKAFLRLITQNNRFFSSMRSDSLLFCPKFYKELCNLNTLNQNDLKKLHKLIGGGEWLDTMQPGTYSFAEIKALYGSTQEMQILYSRLAIPSLDQKLITFNQIKNIHDIREVLDTFAPSALSGIAVCLSSKPLTAWLQDDLSHIRDLTKLDAVHLLAVYPKAKQFLPEITCSRTALLLYDNYEAIEENQSFAAFLESLSKNNTRWDELRTLAGITDDFVRSHPDSVRSFLQNNGAELALTFSQHLSRTDCIGYFNIVKAEAMGKLHEVKYHGADLGLEVGYPVSEQQKISWIQNDSKYTNLPDGEHALHYSAAEYDDFYTTMYLGNYPAWTCINYRNGEQAACLLSVFDSNKKILCAYKNGEIQVARSLIRLTKGRKSPSSTMQASREDERLFKMKELEFQDVESSTTTGDELVVFLERTYHRHLDEKEQLIIGRLFIEIAAQKAKALGARLVVSTRVPAAGEKGMLSDYYVYISKSKAGAQYLDSMGGAADTATEGGYYHGDYYLY